MQRTPLYDFHIEQGAKMVPFHGWEMPLHYGSQIAEHKAVRDGAGLFDVSHMTTVDLAGDEVTDFLRRLLANDVARLEASGQALYSAMLNETGGVIDDLICYRRDNGYRMVVNSATRETDLDWIETQSSGLDVQVTERTDLAMLAIQGPTARQTVALVFPELDTDLAILKPFQALEANDLFIARTGYTGEDGVEILLPVTQAAKLASQLVAQGVQPCGLGARDTLRLEAGLNLYGADMDTTVSPLACGMGWTIDWRDDERCFIGRDIIAAQRAAGDQPRQVGLVLDGKGIMRGGQTVSCNGESLGVITSGSFSPTLQCSIAIARVKRRPGDHCEVDIRGRQVPARMVKLPFVRHGQSLLEENNPS